MPVTKQGRRSALAFAQRARDLAHAQEAVPEAQDPGDALVGSMRVFANPLGGLGGCEAYAELSAAERDKIDRRIGRMLQSLDSSVPHSEQQEAVRLVADKYPVCALGVCAKQGTLMCSACRVGAVKYCSRQCQRQHWLVHRQVCAGGTVDSV